MSGSDVDNDEMPAPQSSDDRALEAFLAGRSTAAPDLAPLAAFTEDLRVVVSGPPPVAPPALAQLLTQGFSIDELPAMAAHANPTVAPADGLAAEGLTPRRRSMRLRQSVGARAAKLAGLGIVAKLALGVGVAAASVTTAGAAGVLPDPAQNVVATVVNTATPLHVDDADQRRHHKVKKTHSRDAKDPSGGDVTGEAGDDTGTGEEGTKPADNHGACVSAIAKTAPTGAGGIHGEVVSEAAKSCPKGHDDDDTTPATTSTTIASAGAATDSGPGQSGKNHGKAGDDHGQNNDGHGQSGEDHPQQNDGNGQGGQPGQ